MDFCCFECCEKFPTCNSALAHLKNVHAVEFGSNKPPIPCLTKFECDKEFKSISGLRKHVEKCLISNSKLKSQMVLIDEIYNFKVGN